jgi:hypothetical protein
MANIVYLIIPEYDSISEKLISDTLILQINPQKQTDAEVRLLNKVFGDSNDYVAAWPKVLYERFGQVAPEDKPKHDIILHVQRHIFSSDKIVLTKTDDYADEQTLDETVVRNLNVDRKKNEILLKTWPHQDEEYISVNDKLRWDELYDSIRAVYSEITQVNN